MTVANPVEFTRDAANRRGTQRCGNIVQIEDADGHDILLTPHAGDALVNEPIANTAAQITLNPGGADRYAVIAGIYWSFSGDPAAAARLTVVDGATAVHAWAITKGGPGFFHYNPPRLFTEDTIVTVTLAAGGAGIFGTLSVHGWIEQ